FAWDVFGNGRTALRGGYSISYVNDQAMLSAKSLLELNAGLQGLATNTGLGNRVSTGLPTIVAPDYHVPRTVEDNYADNPFNTLVKRALTDPNAQFYLQTGEVGELATYYQTNGYNPTNAVTFFQNPNALGADYLTNYSSSSYNALQVEVRHRTKSGFFIEGNY